MVYPDILTPFLVTRWSARKCADTTATPSDFATYSLAIHVKSYLSTGEGGAGIISEGYFGGATTTTPPPPTPPPPPTRSYLDEGGRLRLGAGCVLDVGWSQNTVIWMGRGDPDSKWQSNQRQLICMFLYVLAKKGYIFSGKYLASAPADGCRMYGMFEKQLYHFLYNTSSLN